MTIKIYDRDGRFNVEEVGTAQAQLNALAPGINKSRMTTAGRFELPLEDDLTAEQQTTFRDWGATNHPDWEIVIV